MSDSSSDEGGDAPAVLQRGSSAASNDNNNRNNNNNGSENDSDANDDEDASADEASDSDQSDASLEEELAPLKRKRSAAGSSSSSKGKGKAKAASTKSKKKRKSSSSALNYRSLVDDEAEVRYTTCSHDSNSYTSDSYTFNSYNLSYAESIENCYKHESIAQGHGEAWRSTAVVVHAVRRLQCTVSAQLVAASCYLFVPQHCLRSTVHYSSCRDLQDIAISMLSVAQYSSSKSLSLLMRSSSSTELYVVYNAPITQ
eukprot:20916-Heterococcus_DN1.PRE.2